MNRNLFPPTRRAKVLVFAPHGHGKTTFLATAKDDPRTAPVLFLDFEGGSDSIVDCFDDANFTLLEMHSMSDFYHVWSCLQTGRHAELVARFEPGTKNVPFRSVCIDSLTALNIRAFMTRIGNQATGAPRMPELDDYALVLNTMRDIMYRFIDIQDMHLFASALATDGTDKILGPVKEPHFVGAIAKEISGFLSAVVYLAIGTTATGEDERVLLLKNPRFRTKVRLPAVIPCPDELHNPTISQLLDALQF